MNYEKFLTQFYSDHFKRWGVEPRALDWKDSQSMEMLFDALLGIEGFAVGDSVADVGCGFADLCTHLTE